MNSKTMADGESDDHGKRPSRPPKDMKGLLKFCVENTKAEDAPSAGTFREISPEVMNATCSSTSTDTSDRAMV